ncbi:MAG: c-type cytochrome [Bacteroidales bacterium]|nr:c-type cytochrome [Bacteroidales bacterium]
MNIKSLIFSMLIVAAIFTGCKKDETTQSPYETADAGKGGILYDNFFTVEAGWDTTSASTTTLKAKADFFRCKQCHAWDLLGTAGSYNNRGPKASRPNVNALNIYDLAHTKTAQELFDAMKKTEGRRAFSYDLGTYDPATNATEGDKMPDYSALLTDAQIWDLVKFMKEGAIDVSNLYDATYTGTYPTGSTTYANLGKDGNAAAGNTFFAANCAACHGTDGALILVEDMTVGKFTRKKPNEVHHKVKYGQLGSLMLGNFTMTEANMKDLYKALSDETNFPN